MSYRIYVAAVWGSVAVIGLSAAYAALVAYAALTTGAPHLTPRALYRVITYDSRLNNCHPIPEGMTRAGYAKKLARDYFGDEYPEAIAWPKAGCKKGEFAVAVYLTSLPTASVTIGKGDQPARPATFGFPKE